MSEAAKIKTPNVCKGLPCPGYCAGCPSAHNCKKVLDYIDKLRAQIHDIEVSPRSPSSEMQAGLRAAREELAGMKKLIGEIRA